MLKKLQIATLFRIAKSIKINNLKYMWAKFTDSILKRRSIMLIISLLLTALMFYKGKNVELSYAGAKVLPIDDPSYIAYNEFKQKYGEDGTILVIGVQTEKLFEQEFLNNWYRLSDSLRNIEGISNVLSISHAYELKKDTTKRSFFVQKIMNDTVANQLQADSIKSKFTSLPFYNGLLYNSDSSSTLIAVSFSKETLNSNKRAGVLREIQRISGDFEVKQNIKLHYSGLPYIRTIISNKVASEFVLFLGLAVLITAVILLLFFRSLYAVIFPIIVVGIGVIFSLGTLVLFGYKITLLTALIPPLIVVIGIPNSILLLNKYHTEYMLCQDKMKALAISIKRIGVTTFFANMTTAIGFGVFAFTNSEILTQFGIVASINVMVTWVLSLVLIPIIFSYLPNPKSWQTKHLENKNLNKLIKSIDNWVNNYRPAVYITTVVLILISAVGIMKVNVNGYMVDDLPKNDPVLTDLKFFERNFDGVLPLEIQIDTKRKNGLANIATIKKVEKLEKMIAAYPEISRSISVNEVLKFSKQAYYNGDPIFYKTPTEAEALFILGYAKRSINSGTSGNMMRSYVDSSNQSTRVSFQMADIGSKKMNGLLSEIKTRIDSIFNPEKYNVLMTGSSVIFIKGTNYLFTNLRESLLLAVGLIALLMLSLFRTFRMVIISLLPNIIPLIITAGIMGFAGISLKPSTILIFSIAFGIASDQTLYFLTKFRQEQKSKDWSISKIVSITLKETGLSMIYTAIILFFGFGIFAASTFGGTVSLGILISLTLLVAVISNLILLPTLLLSLEKRINKKIEKERVEKA